LEFFSSPDRFPINIAGCALSKTVTADILRERERELGFQVLKKRTFSEQKHLNDATEAYQKALILSLK